MIAITDFASLIIAAVIFCFAMAICVVTILFVLAMSSKDETRHGQSSPVSIHLELHQAAPYVYTNAVSDPRQLSLPEPRQQYLPESRQQYLPAAQQKYLPAAKREYWNDGQSILLNEQGEVINQTW